MVLKVKKDTGKQVLKVKKKQQGNRLLSIPELWLKVSKILFFILNKHQIEVP